MIKNMTCIQCPQGCQLKADIDGGYLIKLTGNKCPKGLEYARQEIEDPRRILTSSVAADGLSVKMVPVKTDKPIPKKELLNAMAEIKKIRISKRIKINDVVIENFCGLNVDLVAARSVK